MISTQDTVAGIVLSHSACAPIFQKHRIDFCCKGHMSLEEASQSRGIDANALLEELKKAIASRSGKTEEADPRELSTPALIAHIITKHHEYLRKTLPFLIPLSAKVARVHGEHNPKLRDLEGIVKELSEALIPHLDDEERTLFPALMSKSDPALIKKELESMHEEHLEVATLLENMRNATDDFRLPDSACNSYRTLFSELEAMEGDILRHVHLENHVLMPRF